MKHWHRLLVSGLVVVALAVALTLLAPWGQDSLAQGDIIYVDADATTGDNDGSSWDDAFTELQPALAAAVATDQIWVAAGVYTPTAEYGGTGDRFKSFQMKNGVTLYGGFDPDADDIAFEDRDWDANPTILSGDIGIEGDVSDNVYHVFYHPDGTNLNSTAFLDGFSITGGNANGDVDLHDSGGGMYNYSSSPALSNCTFSGNSAVNDGGGMYNHSSSPALTDCTFSGNSVGSGGSGGGMLNNNSSPVLTNCTFSGNSADLGGGMYNTLSSSPALTNCTFSDNSAVNDGGGIFNDGSSPTLTNCTFWGNSADSGGGIYNFYSSPTLTNCILWGDTPDEIFNADPPLRDSSPVVTYSDIQGSYPGDGNINANPLFVDATGGDLRLQLTSPAIDAGDNDASGLGSVTTDLGSHPRFADVPSVADTGNGVPPIVDMGAYEAPPDVIFVDLEATGANNGASWADALTDLQDALAWAVEGVEIWVAEGIYKPAVEYGGTGDRFRSFQLINGVTLYGGFDPDADDIAFEDRDWDANPTILSGDIGIQGDNADNVYHVFYHPDGTNLNSTAILDGFTVTGGNADGDVDPHRDGGGMYNHSSSPVLTNCTFSGNSAGDGGSGGGMLNNNSSPVLTNCTFSGNSADLGGGMFNADSSPALTNCTFSDNSAVHDGGGMLNDYSPTALTNCTFSGNSADSGGGIYNFYSSPTLTNCILWGDTPDEIYNADPPRVSSPVVTYSDIQDSYPGDGNINEDPLFVDPGNGDFHLGAGSPCIDAGDNDAPGLPDYDFEGDTRIIDGDRDGEAVVDMGVDEARIHVYLPLVLRGY